MAFTSWLERSAREICAGEFWNRRCPGPVGHVLAIRTLSGQRLSGQSEAMPVLTRELTLAKVDEIVALDADMRHMLVEIARRRNAGWSQRRGRRGGRTR